MEFNLKGGYAKTIAWIIIFLNKTTIIYGIPKCRGQRNYLPHNLNSYPKLQLNSSNMFSELSVIPTKLDELQLQQINNEIWNVCSSSHGFLDMPDMYLHHTTLAQLSEKGTTYKKTWLAQVATAWKLMRNQYWNEKQHKKKACDWMRHKWSADWEETNILVQSNQSYSNQ